MKKLILFFSIILFSLPVFAQDFSVSNSDITSPNGGGRTGTYTGTEIYNTGSSNVYNIGTRYSGRLSRIIFNLASGGYADPDGFEKGHNYTLTLNMATEDWRNHFGSVSVKCEGSSGTELSNGRVTYVSYKKIKFSFTTPTDRYCQFVYVDLKSSNISNVAFTGTSNWNLSSLVISDSYYNSSGGSSGSGGSSPTPTPSNDYSSIINNQTQNTQDVINNQNSNTQDIIENNNQNTNTIISSVDEVSNAINNGLSNVCGNLFNVNNISNCRINESTGALLCEENGSSIRSEILSTNFQTGTFSFELTSSWRGWSTEFIPVKNLTPYYFNYTGLNFRHFFNFNYYDENKEFLGFNQYWVDSSTFMGITTPRDAKYVKISFSTADTGTYNISNATFSMSGTGFCVFGSSTSKIDETTNAVNEVNDTIKDDNIDDKTGFFTDFQDNDHGLTSIITIPLTTIQQLSNTSCVALSLPIPFTNKNVSLPCMTEVYQQRIPTIFNIWQVVSFGLIAYWICLDIYKMVKGFKDPNEDKIEVLDL